MKQEDIHKGFSMATFRDYFAKTLADYWKNMGDINTKYSNVPIATYYDRLVRDRDSLNEQIEIEKQKNAVLELIKKEGWKEYDISVYLPECVNAFIGNDEEYRKFLTDNGVKPETIDI